MTTALVRYRPAEAGSYFHRRGLLLRLRRELGALEREYARDVERVRQFERRYRPAVGERYDELERLRERIDRAWAALSQSSNGSASGWPGGVDASAESGPGRAQPREEARELFLELARRIHPDLASDATERRRRHEVMAEATLAYRDGDARRLQWLIEHWQAESDPILGFGLSSLAAKTNRQIAWTRYRIRETQYSLGQLHASPIARLMEEHEQARTEGRNLILEMRQQIQQELEDAYRDLERVRQAIGDLEPERRAVVEEEIGIGTA